MNLNQIDVIDAKLLQLSNDLADIKSKLAKIGRTSSPPFDKQELRLILNSLRSARWHIDRVCGYVAEPEEIDQFSVQNRLSALISKIDKLS